MYNMYITVYIYNKDEIIDDGMITGSIQPSLHQGVDGFLSPDPGPYYYRGPVYHN